jgi:hypothetical protein
MPTFAILRTKKLKGVAGVAWASRHNFRERITKNADPEKTPTNTVLVGPRGTDGIVADWKKQAATVTRKIRRDAVTAVEYVVTASEDFFHARSTVDGDRYLRDALAWIEKRHGKERVLSAVIHRDEHTPHLHVMVVPIRKKTNKKGELVTALEAKHWFHGRDQLQAMQDDFHETVGAPHSLTRGVRGSKATHTEIKAWYGALTESGGVEKEKSAVVVHPIDPRTLAELHSACKHKKIPLDEDWRKMLIAFTKADYGIEDPTSADVQEVFGFLERAASARLTSLPSQAPKPQGMAVKKGQDQIR